ncbi:MAG: hypothetical protein V9G04_07640 [Nocardioides sp.]
MTDGHSGSFGDIDPFDLPEWLGDGEVIWRPEHGVHVGALVTGKLTGPTGQTLPCDLLGVDEAYPAPVADDTARTVCHKTWRHGQVWLVEREGRLTLLVPGRDFNADKALEALHRFAKALGAKPQRFAALLRLA